MMKKSALLILGLIILMTACSTRQVMDQYNGATAQRLTSHSVNDMIADMPEADFSRLQDKPVYLECYFLNDIEPLAYAKKRLELELMDKYQCRLINDPADAEMQVYVFFTSLGTDEGSFGLKTPEIAIPGMGLSSIHIISLEMFHGITELYYYIVDDKEQIIAKSDMIKTRVRNDSLALPVITIPINTVD
ncbi:MAG TPA: hypothetical protein VKN73_04050 [Desulfosalsimonadaceae bacterium]|nr:hypothetical protein [Desulfosalsimonadaceae bacterium]